ncbi:MAG: hypothetical protein Q9164_001517 [Protoblastenia rupestris]
MSRIASKQEDAIVAKPRVAPHLRALAWTPKSFVKAEGLSTVATSASRESTKPIVTIKPPIAEDPSITAIGLSNEKIENNNVNGDVATQLWLDQQFNTAVAPSSSQSPAPKLDQLIDFADEGSVDSILRDPVDKTNAKLSASVSVLQDESKNGAHIQRTHMSASPLPKNDKENKSLAASSAPLDPQTLLDKDGKRQLPSSTLADLKIDYMPQTSASRLGSPASPFLKSAHTDSAAFVKDFTSKLSAFSSRWSTPKKKIIGQEHKHNDSDKDKQEEEDDDDSLEEGEVRDVRPTMVPDGVDKPAVLQTIPNGMTIPTRKASQKAKTSPTDHSTKADLQAAAADFFSYEKGPTPTGTRVLGGTMDQASKALVLKPGSRSTSKEPESKDVIWKKVYKVVNGKMKECYVL